MAFRDEEWRDDARCLNHEDPEIFYPARDKATYRTIALKAKESCFGETGNNPCPVRTQCLWYAISSDDQHGIWGGLSHRERNALVRKWQKNYKRSMTLQEYVLQLDKKDLENGS